MADATELPNPFTPLAFLPPDLASQFEVTQYVFAATLGVNRPFFDLIATLNVYLYAKTTVAPVKNCNALMVGLDICLVLSQTSTALLFFLRVTAVWHPSKIAYAIFFILWLGVIAGGITAPIGVRGAHIGPTTQCITTVVPGTIEVAAIMPLINDSAVFLAISYRILAHTIVADSSMARLRVFLGGKGLSTLSQALLQTGQHFYLIAVVTHLVFLVLLKLPQLSPVYHTMFAIPTIALVNAMACLVFRRIKLGLISPDGTLYIPTLDFHATANSRSLPLHLPRTDPTTADLGSNTVFPFDVRVQTVVDKFEDGTEAIEVSKPTDLA
ncbi:hypothetical protein MSAN_01606800 [Mycena sanguinolenta]|uniref:Uncharacterized protein n=1 Tax=Mycena sanguinolenta TaxID=230812 RepID=A0A8H6Y3W9_9AGAR|nr:hypothetical protein MSAN_01606800 [Mycena sanguinolenta]